MIKLLLFFYLLVSFIFTAEAREIDSLAKTYERVGLNSTLYVPKNSAQSKCIDNDFDNQVFVLISEDRSFFYSILTIYNNIGIHSEIWDELLGVDKWIDLNTSKFKKEIDLLFPVIVRSKISQSENDIYWQGENPNQKVLIQKYKKKFIVTLEYLSVDLNSIDKCCLLNKTKTIINFNKFVLNAVIE